MKTIKTIRRNSHAYNWVVDTINTHEKYRNCFFWRVPASSSQRRKEEFHDAYQFRLAGIVYDVQQALELSSRNYYYSLSIHVDGKKKDIRALKKLIGGGK